MIYRTNRHCESPADDVVAGATIVDRDGDKGRATGIRHRREGQGTVRVRAGIIDGRIANQIGIAGSRSDRENLILVGGAGGDAVQIDRLQAGVLIDRQVVDGVQGRGLIDGSGIRGDRVRHFIRKRTLDTGTVIRCGGKIIGVSLNQAGNGDVCGIAGRKCVGIISAGSTIVNVVTYNSWITARIPCKRHVLGKGRQLYDKGHPT